MGLSLAATTAAFLAGFSLAPLWWFVAATGPLAILAALLVVVALGAASIWLARRSLVPLRWLAWPLLGAVAAGLLGFAAWIASIWESMD